MMKKYPLTSDGINSLQDQLYSLGNGDLRVEAEMLAADPCAWIAGHIELEVHQLECLRSIKKSFIQMFGWSIAAAVLARRPINLSYREDAIRNDPHKKSCILYKCGISSHYTDKSSFSAGNLDIVITE